VNRREFQDHIDYCKRELDWLLAQPTNCTTCAQFDRDVQVCKCFGQVPVEFVMQGCDEWDFDEVPF